MVKSKFYNLDTDATLSSNSDYYVPSEKAVKAYVDNNIPTVNNATLTIQKNGITVNTFTANASSNVTANITVPTKTSDLTNDDGFISGITSSDVTTALGYTPYNSTNPSGYQANVIETIKVNGTAQTVTSKAVDITVPTNNNQLTNGAGYITNAALADYSKTEDTVSAVVAGTTADKINVTKNGSTSTITINNVTNAVNATKATQDASGNVITTTYATKSELPTTTIRTWS